MRDKGSHFPDVESKRNTTTVQQKSRRVREREIPKIDLEAIREGGEVGKGGLLLCLAVSLCHAHADAGFWGFGYQMRCREKPHCPCGGSDVSFLQALRLPSVETGWGSQVASGLKSALKFPSTSAVVALKFWGRGERGHCQHRVPAACSAFLGCETAPRPPHPALPLPSLQPLLTRGNLLSV